MEKIFLGSDHAGYKLKEFLKKNFDKKKIKYSDLGADSEESSDYPDFALKVAKNVAEKRGNGILVCGTGTGMVIAANKIKGVRAALAYDDYSARMARLHNNVNVLCLRGRKIDFKKAQRIVDIWLKTEFSGEKRHARRMGKISRIEKQNFRK
ncbi:MAG TPA: ribose 5-phosphate isomerase B [Candidatus Nanoarchaeia archaeon]|nr:ribose 5-phosphate isomerase B [Candidatus Nanoarchaeia archaeon]